MNDCPPENACVSSGFGCACVQEVIPTLGDGIWTLQEACDASAGNPTAQCRYTLGDVSNTQYLCNQGTCVALSFGQSYVGDGIVQGQNSQGLQEECEPPFNYNQQKKKMCGISGRYITDSDGDGVSDSEELNKVYGRATNPNAFDSDCDTISDGAEILAGFNPTLVQDMVQLGIQQNNGFLNSPAYPSVQNVEQCDRPSQGIYGNNYCQQQFGMVKCSDLNSHCVMKDKPGAGGTAACECQDDDDEDDDEYDDDNDDEECDDG